MTFQYYHYFHNSEERVLPLKCNQKLRSNIDMQPQPCGSHLTRAEHAATFLWFDETWHRTFGSGFSKHTAEKAAGFFYLSLGKHG